MSLTIIIPGLIWPDRGDIDYLYKDLNIPYLENFIKSAEVKYLNYGYSDLIYSINQQNNNLPLSHKYARNLKVEHEFSNFLIAEPTHLRIDRDRLLISEPELLQLDNPEVKEIIELINKHFAPLFKLYYVNEELWLLGTNIETHTEKFYPLIDIIGENIDDYLPKGINSLKLNSFINELQMLLFNTHVNQNRSLEKSLTVNSLWLWDKEIADLSIHYDKVFANKNIIPLYHDKIEPLANNIIDKIQANNNNLIILDNLYYPAKYRDSYSWQNKLEEIDDSIFKILQENNYKNFTLAIPGIDKTLQINITKSLFSLFKKKNNLHNLVKEWHAT